MIKLLDCSEELAQRCIDTFGDWYVKADYQLKNGLYQVTFKDQYYTFNITVHTQFITITRVPMAGETSDNTIATMSINTNDFWKLEVL